MSRIITYKCDRCREPVPGKSVIKIAANVCRGGATEKKSLDFCEKCFQAVSKAFQDAIAEGTKAPDTPVQESVPEAVQQSPAMDSVAPGRDEPTEDIERTPAQASGPVWYADKGMEAASDAATGPAAAVSQEPAAHALQADNGLVTGPISEEDREEILRLYVCEGMDPEGIAARMHRLPRGINRAINAARKSGELDRLRAEHVDMADGPEDAPGDEGSGVSDSRVGRNAHVAPPQIEVINGRRYDAGGILALARAGWSPEAIASERHYDTVAVKQILERHMGKRT